MELGGSMTLKDIRRIGIIGAGLMGHGIAQVFASAGYDVNLYDADKATLEAAKGKIEANFKSFIALGLAKPEDVAGCLGRISLCPSLESLCKGPQYIIEAILEDLELKRKVFAEVERHAAPDAILSSNTSAISITEIGAALKNRGRFLGTHFWNPPQVLPCVEVIRGDETAEGAFETVFALMEKVGKVPVRVLKDVPGFLGNRLQHAMWREAISLCDKKVASAEDIDKVVKYGFGARMPFIGPMETADLAGLDPDTRHPPVSLPLPRVGHEAGAGPGRARFRRGNRRQGRKGVLRVDAREDPADHPAARHGPAAHSSRDHRGSETRLTEKVPCRSGVD